MAWCKLEDTFHASPKVARLARVLGISQVLARGHLATLWSWCTTFAPDGDLSSYLPEDIEHASGWEGPAGELWAALCDERCRFVDITDQGPELHQWEERAVTYVRARRRQRTRGVVDHVTTSGRPVVDHVATSGSARGEERRGEEKRVAPKLELALESAPTSPGVITYPAQGKRSTWVLTEAHLAKLQAAYPGLDVLAEARKALAKVETGACRQPTAKGYPRFLASWLDRSVDRGPPGQQRGIPGPAADDFEGLVQLAAKRGRSSPPELTETQRRGLRAVGGWSALCAAAPRDLPAMRSRYLDAARDGPPPAAVRDLARTIGGGP